MFLNKPRDITIECSNEKCPQYKKKQVLGAQNINSEDLEEILVCPSCGKSIEIKQIKLSKTNLNYAKKHNGSKEHRTKSLRRAI